MLNLDWITEDEYKEAYKQAQVICEGFMLNQHTDGEQLWTEIEVGGKFFDIECWEEDAPEYDWDDFDKRQNPVHCALYATKVTDDGFRHTDDWAYLELFTMGGDDK